MNRGGAIWVLATLVFVSEIALAVGAWMAGTSVGSGAWSLAAGVLCVAVVIAVWATWMAPKAANRLSVGKRTMLGCGLFLIVGTAVSATGHWFGPVLLLAGCALTVIGQPRLDALHVESQP